MYTKYSKIDTLSYSIKCRAKVGPELWISLEPTRKREFVVLHLRLDIIHVYIMNNGIYPETESDSSRRKVI